MGGRDAAPIHLVLEAPSYPLDPSSLTGLSSMIRVRLEEASRRGVSWHKESSETIVNILAALYGRWVPLGREKGIDRIVILSKGHGSLALYAAYEVLGVIPKGSLESQFLAVGSSLQAHPEAGRLPGIPVSTGSLGQGLSIANGIALASKRVLKRDVEVAVVVGDGELDEGQMWEAIATSSSQRLDNVFMIVDRNRFQHSGPTEEVKPKEPLALRLRAFNWHVVEVADDPVSIAWALESLGNQKGAPKALIVNTWANNH